jgi:putative heme-binding domain-containing protein
MRPLILCFVFCILCFPKSLRAISVGTTERDTSPEAELASFTVLDGFEVNLFASEKDGIANPISIRWDEHGRLWVLTTSSYPQPKPGDPCDDRILILEDTDKDGKADKTTVFADQLRMPMGLELAPSVKWPKALAQGDAVPPRACAAYIGEGEKLWLMRDTDGDGRADQREVVFSGFGTGDTHQNINSFTWTPDGALMMSQGLHCYSNITTAYGGRKLYGAGYWLYRPLSGKLTPYPTGFPANAWGVVYDDHGQPFGVAGAAGMFWVTPMLVSTEHLIERLALPNSGQIVKQGMLKYCGVDIPRNAHWPQDMHGELVSGGFFENCIYRHKLQDDAANPSGYEAVRQPDLIKSSSVSFRPVDVKFGPEGALYISDWYNPIIGHYQASFRHPDRDKTHGRIWRVVKKGADLMDGTRVERRSPSIDRGMVTLSQANIHELWRALEWGDRWTQSQSHRLLMGRSEELLTPSNKGSLPSIEFTSPPDLSGEVQRPLLFWLQLSQAAEKTDLGLQTTLLDSSGSFVRAYATRSLASGSPGTSDLLTPLGKSIADDSPRVRVEAIAACAHIPKVESIAVALRALDKPMDTFHERTLKLAIHSLAPHWEPALKAGKLKLPPKHLAYLLEEKSSPEFLTSIRAMLKDSADKLDPESRRVLLLLLAKQGSSDDVATALDAGLKDPALLSEFTDLVESQNLKAPNGTEAKVGEASSLATRGNAPPPTTTPPLARLIGLWKLSSLSKDLDAILTSKEASPESQRHALVALARLDAPAEKLAPFAQDPQRPWLVRLGAVEALCERHPAKAASSALVLMPVAKSEDDMRTLLAPFLAKAPRMKALTAALRDTPCSKESADLATRTLIAIGRNEPGLTALLNGILGRITPTQPYDSQWVSSLANSALVAGDPKHGKEIYERVTLNCIACHNIGGKGGITGPQLDAVGRGVPTELLVEAVLWPQRQIKEGYVATTITMKDGRMLAGYKVAENPTDLQVRDMATQQISKLPKAAIQSRTDAGSLMPEGLTASLSREELRDLIAYLASLGK